MRRGWLSPSDDLSTDCGPGTGALWRIRRVAGRPVGKEPQPARRVPFYPIQAGVVIAAVGAGIAAIVAIVAIARRVRRR